MATPVLRPPLHLPLGSVRALLTLGIVAVVIVEVLRGREVAPLWVETLMIALAHYFTSRRFLTLPPEIRARLEAEGYIEEERTPLFLPRHSIRALILLGFAGLAVVLYREDRLMEPQALGILAVVSSYLLGMVVSALLAWWFQGKPSPTLLWWEDLKALVVLLVLLVTASAFLADRADLVPTQLQNTTLALVLFYFGSR